FDNSRPTPFQTVMLMLQDLGASKPLTGSPGTTQGGLRTTLLNRQAAQCPIRPSCPPECDAAQVWQLLEDICHNTAPNEFGQSSQRLRGGRQEVIRRLRQWLACKDPHETICAEIAKARELLVSNQRVLQQYQDLVDKINRGEFNKTFREAQDAIVVELEKQAREHGAQRQTVRNPGKTEWSDTLGRPVITIGDPPPSGCTAIDLLETIIHELRHYHDLMKTPALRDANPEDRGRAIIPKLQEEIDDYTALIDYLQNTFLPMWSQCEQLCCQNQGGALHREHDEADEPATPVHCCGTRAPDPAGGRATSRRQLRAGLFAALQRRASFSREHRGAFAARFEGDDADSSDFAAGWHQGERVCFAWHQNTD